MSKEVDVLLEMGFEVATPEETVAGTENSQPWSPMVVLNQMAAMKAEIQRLREALAEQPAPVHQEPVAWFKHGPYEDGEPLSVVFEDPNDDVCYSPLGFIDNTSPQPAQRTWVGVTDDETEHLWEVSRAALPRYHTFKTLIEKALRERNT